MAGKPGRSGGHNRKPRAIKRLEGNRRKVARAELEKEEPRGMGRPRLPVHLSTEERRLWSDVVSSLPSDLLSQADEAVLERFVVAWAEFRDAHVKITKTGTLVQSPQGPIRNPLLTVRHQAAREMHLAGGEIGLSPVARARLTTEGREEDDPMALLLGDDLDPAGAWASVPRTRQ